MLVYFPSVELKELTVSIGGLDTSTIGEDGVWEERTISKAECHPSYLSMTEENDICVLKLNKPSTKEVREKSSRSLACALHSMFYVWFAF
jgi:hypothetical protein